MFFTEVQCQVNKWAIQSAAQTNNVEKLQKINILTCRVHFRSSNFCSSSSSNSDPTSWDWQSVFYTPQILNIKMTVSHMLLSISRSHDCCLEKMWLPTCGWRDCSLQSAVPECFFFFGDCGGGKWLGWSALPILMFLSWFLILMLMQLHSVCILMCRSLLNVFISILYPLAKSDRC